jgi:hypothetical protein
MTYPLGQATFDANMLAHAIRTPLVVWPPSRMRGQCYR